MEALIAGRVRRLQFASAGQWERALVAPAPAALAAWLDAAGDDVALELFFDPPGARARFVGVRFTGLARAERDRLCAAAARWFDDLRAPTAQAALAWLRDAAATPALFTGAPAFLELGVVDQWQSGGPARFWTAADGGPARAAFDRLRREQPRFDAAFDNPLAIELGFAGPPPHWLGVVVSAPAGAGHRLDVAAVDALLGALDAPR